MYKGINSYNKESLECIPQRTITREREKKTIQKDAFKYYVLGGS